jgi:uncharacterized integral membrane protein (TIGR00698 family)
MLPFKNKLSGVSVAVIVGLAAMFLSEHYGAPAMLFALLLGIALSFLYQETQCKTGVDFAASTVLRVGVALLGFRLSFSDLTALGWQTTITLFVAIISTIIFGVFLAKLLGLSKRFGALTGGSVAICGASAAMAIASVYPSDKHKERDTLLTIIGVTSLSTIAMILYPIIASFLEMPLQDTSIFIGGTIHDVAQVVGAGYSISQETGDMATLIKLVRVSFLMPIVFMFLLVIKAKCEVDPATKAPGFPLFLIAFALIMALNSLVAIPEIITETATNISRFALVVSIAAIGMKSNLSQLVTVGIKPIILMVSETLFIALFILIALWCF